MADQQFDGNTPVSGYTLFKGKDGQNFYLKGENLADEEITSRVAKLRGTASQSSEAQQVQAGLPGYPKPAQPQPSNLGTIATGPPLMSMQPGLPSAAQVPQNAERMSEGAMIGMPIGGVISGGAAALPAIGRSIAQGTALGAAGKYLGNMISPTTGHVLGTLGALAGGIRGARSAPEMEEIPPEWTSPTHTEIPSGSPEYPLSAKIKAGTAMKIPSRLTKAQIEALRPQEPAKLSDLAQQQPTITKPSVEVAPGEGRPATWTNEVVKDRAAWGDPDAIDQARLRGFGRIPLKFSTTDVTPRSVTRFNEQGQAIPEGEANLSQLAGPKVSKPQPAPVEKTPTIGPEHEMKETMNASLKGLRERITNVRLGPIEGDEGTMLFEFDGKTYSAPEPMDVMLEGKGSNAQNARARALRTLLDKTATGKH